MLALTTNSSGKKLSFCLIETLHDIRAGSMAGNYVYLPFKGVSRQHFSLIRNGSNWILNDLGSRNGTFLNGRKIREAPLVVGDLIQAGIVKLQVEHADHDTDTIFLESIDRLFPAANDGAHGLAFPQEIIPGHSPSVIHVYRLLHTLAAGHAHVVFIGEAGTGKRTLARTLHASSSQADQPISEVHFFQVPEDLAQSKLAAAVQTAQRGTLLFHELSACPFALQSEIFRVVESARFRIMATSLEEPKELIQSGRLREDLYQRLAGLEVHVPPLRERPDDIIRLLIGMVKHFSKIEDKPIAGIRKAVARELQHYSYPGNIRELSNIARSMVALANAGDVLGLDLLPDKILRGAAFQQTDKMQLPDLTREPVKLHRHIDDVTRALVRQAIEINLGNLPKAAEHLGLTPRGLRKMMDRLNIDLPE